MSEETPTSEPFADASARSTIYELANGELGCRTATSTFYRPKAGRLGGQLVKASDITLSPVRVLELQAPAATHRVFVQPSEARWTYAFTLGELRDITPTALEWQIGLAEYSQPNAAQRNPR
ncbi:hypothetical protein BH11GEM2_BH11GEM2_37650 [soil metagenome]